MTTAISTTELSAFQGSGRGPATVGAEDGVLDRLARIELPDLASADQLPEVRHAVSAAGQEMHVVWTEDCKCS
jgi:hypothetical protein